jgi:hypothetical protein
MCHKLSSIIHVVILSLIFFLGYRDITAAPIPLWGTGLDAQGQILSPGMDDPHYVIVEAPSDYTTPIIPKVTIDNPWYWGEWSWAPNTSTSQWINSTGFALEDLQAGYYSYETSFDLSGLNPATAKIEGAWAADNEGEIFLNGQSTGITLPFESFSLNQLNNFSIIQGFQTGVNTLDFVVLNDSVGGLLPYNPTGVQVQITTAIAAPIPEPSTFALLGIGIVALLGLAWRRR